MKTITLKGQYDRYVVTANNTANVFNSLDEALAFISTERGVKSRRKRIIQNEAPAIEYLRHISANWGKWEKHHRQLIRAIRIVLAGIKGEVSK